MVKLVGLAGLVGVVLAAAGGSIGNGCQDTRVSMTELQYPPYRDMRRTVVINPQKVVMLAPDSASVSTDGRDRTIPFEQRATVAERLTNPVEADEVSIERGQKTYQVFCTPCHGKSMAGDGPVAQSFMPPPDLLGTMTRGRSDGYMYAYIRFGGAVMPKYGHLVTANETWDVINYVRHMQRTSPR
jgi:mono/diheme cytochrome c family protein